jgi:hypothetical protein|nr:MAG TPA: hypothetical protein [Caudoviricetes sp.]
MFESKTVIIISAFLVFVTIAVVIIFDDQEIQKESEENVPEDRFVKIEEWSTNFIMYDKETKVQYFVFEGGITPLLNSEGKPILYLEGE